MSIPLGYQYLYVIDTTPSEATPTWARLGAGLTSADPANNDTVDDTAYLDGDGYNAPDVTGAAYQIDFSGHRIVGDSAQDYIFNTIIFELGDARVTSFRAINPNGDMKSGSVTITDIDPGGGDANSKRDVSFSCRFRGKPTVTNKSAASALTATVAGGTASGTTSFTATADSGNSLAYKLTSASVGTVYGDSYPAQLTAYETGGDIPATIGQFISMYELDSYGRVAKFLEEELEAGDITA